MAVTPRRLNVVQICDHLGWPGTRMHGVKRLFAWMIPRFDAARFRVSLISLRAPDTSGDRLEDHGIDVTYLSRSKFDPRTLSALLAELDRRGTDVVHLHGYGATTFGRLAAARRGWPALLHEHCNLGDTPWFQKVADRLLAPHTDLAIAVSRSTAEFVTRARMVPEALTRVVYLGAPAEEFARPRTADEVLATRSSLGLPAGVPVVGTVTRLMPAKGNQYLVEAAKTVLDDVPDAHFCIVGEGDLVRRTLTGEDQRAAGRGGPPLHFLNLLGRAADDEDARGGCVARSNRSCSTRIAGSARRLPINPTGAWRGRPRQPVRVSTPGCTSDL